MKAKEIVELSCLASGNSPWNYHGATFSKDLFFLAVFHHRIPGWFPKQKTRGKQRVPSSRSHAAQHMGRGLTVMQFCFG
jgi:hypothetical protein